MSYLFDVRERFARKEIARGRSGRLVVNELVHQGHCDAEKARELVSRLGPEIYLSLNRRYGLILTIGLFLLVAAVFAVCIPNSPLRTETFLWIAVIFGPILTVVGWIGAARYHAWNCDLEESDGRAARLDGLAREQLLRGLGTWSVVHELVRVGHIDKESAQAIVESVRPNLAGRTARPGRRMLLFGLVILAVPAAIFVPFAFDIVVLYGGTSQFWPRLYGVIRLILSVPMLLWGFFGLVLVSYGWSAMRRSRNSFTPDVPSGPVSTGLWWRADPFEWK